MEDIRREYEPEPARAHEELSELVGLCLWDVFSDNHDVITADGRSADIGSFRGAGAFLDKHLTGDRGGRREGDYLRFYLGTIWICGRADLTPVYVMIYRRIKALGGDWICHFPHVGLVDLGASRPEPQSVRQYSPNEALAAERQTREREAELARVRGT